MMLRYIACTAILFCSPVCAQQFRIDTKVYANGNKKPISVSQTLFDKAVAYDFLENPREVAIIELNSGKIQLVDVARKMVTRVGARQMFQFVAAIQARLLKKPNRVAVWLFDPKFELNYDPIRRQIKLTHPFLTYTAIGTPVEGKVKGADMNFQLFADAMARLNTFRNGVPPRPRLRLNLAMRSRKLIPTKVNRVIAFNSGPKQTAKSVHTIKWALNEQDLARIEKAQGYLSDKQFRNVALRKFAVNLKAN